LQLLEKISSTQETLNQQGKLNAIDFSPKEIYSSRLYSHNSDVDRINAVELSRLKTEERKYMARDSGQSMEDLLTAIITLSSLGTSPFLNSLKKNASAPEAVALKVGAQVGFFPIILKVIFFG
jgi:hypothetical protein